LFKHTLDRSLRIVLYYILQHKVSSICWSEKSDQLILSGDENGTLGVWQYKDNRQTAYKLDKSAILCLALAPFKSGLVAVGYELDESFS